MVNALFFGISTQYFSRIKNPFFDSPDCPRSTRKDWLPASGFLQSLLVWSPMACSYLTMTVLYPFFRSDSGSMGSNSPSPRVEAMIFLIFFWVFGPKFMLFGFLEAGLWLSVDAVPLFVCF